MQLVERHIFKKSKELFDLCHKAKNLYNYVNYMLRQYFINTGRLPSQWDIMGILAKEKQEDFAALNSQVAQQTVLLLYKNWKSFFKAAIKEYTKYPKKFTGKPSIPKYKDRDKGVFIVVFTINACRIKEGYIHFSKKANLPPLKTKQQAFNQVRIVPQHSCYVIEVVYTKEKEEINDLDNNKYLGIDLGINNLTTLVTNSGDQHPILVNGKIVKSINQYFNKKKAEAQSYLPEKVHNSNRLDRLSFKRGNKINDYLHKTSRFIINYCIQNKIGNIVIGYNEGWKQESDIGKVNNQKFINIPHLKLINQIKYKAELVGIEVQTINESHTSKCDSLYKESIEHHDIYSGRRIHRGLFSSSTNKLINADVNGGVNILRKVIGESFLGEIADRGLAFNPIRMKYPNKEYFSERGRPSLLFIGAANNLKKEFIT